MVKKKAPVKPRGKAPSPEKEMLAAYHKAFQALASIRVDLTEENVAGSNVANVMLAASRHIEEYRRIYWRVR